MTHGLSLDDPRYFDRLAQAESTHWWSDAMWRIASLWLDRALRGKRSLNALDVGCGTGGTLRLLRDRPEIHSAIGIEPSEFALDHVRSEVMVRASALALPFASCSFDIVTCFDVMQHLREDGDRIASCEIFRVLRPGGIALIRANGRGLWPDPHADRAPYRLNELRDVIESGGLCVVRSSYVNCIPAVAAEVVGKLVGTSSTFGHPSGRGLRLTVSGRSRNLCMRVVAKAEAVAVGRFGARLPVGHSTMILAVANAEGRA